MGLFFTLFYVFTAYIGPQVLFGDLAQYHIEIVIVLLALVFSLPSLQDSNLLGIPQTYGILGLTVAVMCSIAFNGWLGGAPAAMMDFIPGAITFFLVLLNCKKKAHLQTLIAVLLVAAVFTIFRGIAAERAGNDVSLYVITMKDNAGEDFYRIRGADFINDPNDFAQFMVALIPCVFFFWYKDKKIRNVIFVYLPIAFLLYGMFLTHSRGGMVALMVAAVVAGRRKLGVPGALVLGVALFAAMSLAGFSGGRDVSADAGEDRMEAWRAGLMMLRTHPLFGVGFRRFTEFHEITAHNIVMLLAAEVGLVGLFFWMMFCVPVVRDAFVASGVPQSKDDETKKIELRKRKIPFSGETGTTPGSEPVAIATALPLAVASPSRGPYGGNFPNQMGGNETPDAEIHRLANLMLISFAGFLAAGWFLARSYTLSLFLNAGIVAAIYGMARKRGIAPPPFPMLRAAKLAVIASVVAITLIWLTLRINHQ